MYHIELRHFPHNACRFNLNDDQLHAVAALWAHDQVVEVGERKWLPQLAKLTILEGPMLKPAQLSMGRGWRTAQRQSEDVTERVLAALRDRTADVASDAQTDAPAEVPTDLVSLLGDDGPRLLAAWLSAAARSPELAPSESLALAEHAVRTSGGNSG
jgi:hypothetical protein